MFKSIAVIFLAAASIASAAPVEAASAEAAKRSSSGTGTWYEQGGNPGNCGWYKSDWDNIIALPSGVYDGGNHCGKWVTIRNKDTGAQTAAMVADSCPSCGSNDDLDLSKNVFGQLSNWNYGQGVVDIEWWFQ